MMASGSAVQVKGLGLSLVAIDGGLGIDDTLEDAELSRCRDSLAKKPSTALSQEAEVGVKWNLGSVRARPATWDACASDSCRRSGATPTRPGSLG